MWRLDELIGRDLTEWVADACGWDERFARVESALARRLAAADPVRPEIRWAVARLQRSRGRTRVEELAREIGWSRRHLAAEFNDAVGVGAQGAGAADPLRVRARELRAGRALADVAYAAGYADQAHLNRDFRAFTGLAPTEYLRRIEDPSVLGVVTFVQDAARAAA